MIKNKKLLQKMCLLTGVFCLLIGCSKGEKTEKSETYTVQSYVTEYKGFFVSKYTDNSDCTGFHILLTNGSHVKAGTIVAEKIQENNSDLEQLQNEMMSYENKRASIDQEIECIQNGDISKCQEIQSSMQDISEQIKELEYTLKENELSRKENKINYEKQIADLDRELQESQKQIDSLKKKKSEVEEKELLAEIEKEIIELNQTILEINANKDYEKQNYLISENRLNLSDDKTNESIGQLQNTYRQLSIADNNNSTVIAALEELENARDICQQNIVALDTQIKGHEIEQIVAPYDAQINISESNMIFYSEEKQFVFKATEKQMKMLSDNTSTMKVQTMENVGNLTLESTLYDSISSELGNGVYYKMVYNIEWENVVEVLMYGTSGVMTSEKEIFIPREYIKNKGDQYYVIIDNQEHEVDVEDTENGWKIKSGLKEGDVIERIGDSFD